MTAGTFAFGTGAFGIAQAGAASEPRGQVVGSRKIDALRGTYVQTTDGTGAFEGMSATMQRVYFALARIKEPEKIDEGFAQAFRLAAASALSSLTTGPNAVAELVGVEVDDFGTSTTVRRVIVRDLTTGEVVKIGAPR